MITFPGEVVRLGGALMLDQWFRGFMEKQYSLPSRCPKLKMIRPKMHMKPAHAFQTHVHDQNLMMPELDSQTTTLHHHDGGQSGNTIPTTYVGTAAGIK
jgi:hypothetical protein